MDGSRINSIQAPEFSASKFVFEARRTMLFPEKLRVMKMDKKENKTIY